jgi:peptidoglycan/xylan/chitin deacetylase (PgdA/CDA1 family)
MEHLSEQLEETVKFIFAAVYFLYLKLLNKRPCRVVIYYHSVKKQDIPTFRRQMEYLAHNCVVTKTSEIKSFQPNGNNRLVAITFDDAFQNVVENAVPILKKFNFPAGFFIPTGNLGQMPRWNIPRDCPDRGESVMSAGQIVQLDKDGFEIFSHSVTHPLLTEVSNDKLKKELEQSKRDLEKIVNHKITGFAYPHGVYDDRVCRAERRADYEMGFTIEPQLVDRFTDELKIGRTEVSANYGLIKFKLKVSGAYQITKYTQKSKQLVKNLLSLSQHRK